MCPANLIIPNELPDKMQSWHNLENAAYKEMERNPRKLLYHSTIKQHAYTAYCLYVVRVRNVHSYNLNKEALKLFKVVDWWCYKTFIHGQKTISPHYINQRGLPKKHNLQSKIENGSLKTISMLREHSIAIFPHIGMQCSPHTISIQGISFKKSGSY